MSETSRPDVPADSVTLPSGAAMPTLGFGTWQIKGDEAVAVAVTASSPLICQVPKPSAGIAVPLGRVTLSAGTSGREVSVIGRD